MGKSLAAKILASDNQRVVDTDDIARDQVQPGSAALTEIAERFGADVIAADGSLRREVLANLVFADSRARKWLEDILHPRIREAWRAVVDGWRKQGGDRGFVVIPLLFETSAEHAFDRVICIACPRSLQIERLSSRGWSREELDRREAAQWPVLEKMNRADVVCWNAGSRGLLERQLEEMMKSEVR